ncbi:MAG: DNA methyltransferase, partial [Rhizobiales bacterium]|nr:DNA methyltransferase [Hyphomicrobiales bacterium]
KIRYLTTHYEMVSSHVGGRSPVAIEESLTEDIKWTRGLKASLAANAPLDWDGLNIRRSLYRPYEDKYVYFSGRLNEFQYQTPEIWPDAYRDNVVIGFTVGGRLDFYPFTTNVVPSLTVMSLDANQLLPRYRYTAAGERVDNVTDWGLRQFTDRYGKSAMITKDAIFHYVYGVLHDPVYRETYALNLKREFPRIPFYTDFWKWAEWGQRLMDLHIGYETIEPWPVERTEAPDEKAKAAGVSPKVLLKADRDNGRTTGLETARRSIGFSTSTRKKRHGIRPCERNSTPTGLPTTRRR